MPQKAASYGMRVDENGAVFTESTDNLGKHTDYETKISDTDIAVSVNGTTHHLHNEMIANTMAQALMDASHHKKLLEKIGELNLTLVDIAHDQTPSNSDLDRFRTAAKAAGIDIVEKSPSR